MLKTKIQLAILITSALGVFGSLYFSEIMKLPPCSLCWYQRIFLYPIPLLILLDVLRGKESDFLNLLGLSSIGLIISGYHNLLYYGVIENIVPCSQGVSCTSRQIEWLGFITIPFLSLLAFSGITIVLIYSLYFAKTESLINEK